MHEKSTIDFKNLRKEDKIELLLQTGLFDQDYLEGLSDSQLIDLYSDYVD